MEDRIKKLIEEYIAGTLEEGKRKELLKLAEDNQEIMQELNLEQHTMNIGVHVVRRELKVELNQIHDELFSEEASEIKKKPKWLGILLLVGIILISFFLFQIMSKKVSPDILIADYYQPFDLELGKRTSVESLFQPLVDNYKIGNHQEVVKLYNSSSTQELEFPSEILLSVAISNMETKNFKKALDVFAVLDERNDFNIQDEVDWYKAINFLQEGDEEKLKISLNQIQEDKNHDYYQQSISLLKKI